ncbi:MAG: choice-of-anchor I family protein [Weeksellaceae bacterium]|nr:choice-of-anchor I family protein [Weeksellaceae bacterium]
MTKNLLLAYLLLAMLLAFSSKASAQNLIHYWNFNDNTTVESLTAPNTMLVAGAAISHIAGGESEIAFANGTGQNFDVENLNARNGDPAGTHLRFNNPIGGALEFSLPTTGFQDIVVQFATRRSGSGAGTQTWLYSTDGVNFETFTTIEPNNGNPTLQVLDFSQTAFVNDNPNFALRVEFSTGSGGNVGNNRFDNFTVEGTEAGGEDTTPPVASFNPANNTTDVATSVQPIISFNEEIRLSSGDEITSENISSFIQFSIANAEGESVQYTAEINGATITLTPIQALAPNTTYHIAIVPGMIEDMSGNILTESSSTSFTTAGTSISLANNFFTVHENHGTLALIINISEPTEASFDLVVKPAPWSTADQNDFDFATQTIYLTPESPTEYVVEIPIIDDNEVEQHAEYFVLSLENPNNVAIEGNSLATIYIIDNDSSAPVPSQQIELNYIGSFDPSGENSASTEIVDFDPVSQRLFTTSGTTATLDIINFSNPAAPSVFASIDMSQYGTLTSVAVKNGIVAVASPNVNPQLDGSVVFFDTDGNYINQVTVGALPDMIVFTPDASKVLTANEGEPNHDYSIDPEGSVSIINLANGVENLTQFDVNTLYFTQFNSMESSLVASGIRKLKASSTLSQDLEPEYITISADGQTAWVAFQENNAIGQINLANNTVTNLWALGKKDMMLPGNGFDVSDNNGEILIANWPVKSFYIPDAIASYQVNGVNYVLTANEGDEKEFATLNERTTVGSNSYQLNPDNFPHAEMLKQSYNLGRFRVTNLNGDHTGDGVFEEINSVGARSFSIFNADTQQIVYDSGDDFERYTAEHYTSIFNADHGSNTAKVRSRSKGPEPEGITLGAFGGETFAFISLERIGGVMVYNVTNPNSPVFVDYKNTRSTSAYGGDLGAEGILYIASEDSPTGKAYIVVANEVSGTLTIYEIDKKLLSATEQVVVAPQTLAVFPNPVRKGETLYFNRAVEYAIYDVTGRMLWNAKDALMVDTTALMPGLYFIKTTEGITKKLIVK